MKKKIQEILLKKTKKLLVSLRLSPRKAYYGQGILDGQSKSNPKYPCSPLPRVEFLFTWIWSKIAWLHVDANGIIEVDVFRDSLFESLDRVAVLFLEKKYVRLFFDDLMLYYLRQKKMPPGA